MRATNPDRMLCPYAVGDILYTINTTNPAQRWPGTKWQQIADCFVRGADGSHPAGSTGGSWTHTQTAKEVGPHDHVENFTYTQGVRPVASGGGTSGSGKYHPLDTVESGGVSLYVSTEIAGEGSPMDISNPYYCAYIWLRTA